MPPSSSNPDAQPEAKAQKRSSRSGPILILGLGLLLLGGVIYAIRVIQGAPEAGAGGPGGGGMQGPPPAAVYVVPIREEAAQNEAVVTGALRSVSRSDVAAREQGAVSEILVDEGQVVEAGELLIKLDKRRISAQLAEANARYTSALNLIKQREAEEKRAEKDVEMKSALVRQRAVSQSEILDAERSLAVAKAQKATAIDAVAEAESRVEFLQVQRDDLDIKAPFSGLVAQRHIEPGEWVAPGQTLISLVTTDPIEAWLRVPGRYLAEVSHHPENIRVRLSSTGAIHHPTAVQVVPDVDPRSQLFTVIATLDNKESLLAPGQSVTGIVPLGKLQPHWAVPVDALLRPQAGTFVFVVDQVEGEPLPKSRQVPATIAFERDGLAYFLPSSTDFRPGDRVVVEGNDRLQPGQPLMVQETGEPQPPPKP